MGISSGVAYLDHGWQTLVDGLEARARSLNVEIRLGTPVDVLPECDGVILAVPPEAVETLTGARFPNVRPIRVACLDLGLASLPESAPTFGLGVDQPLYFSVHSASARLAPAGCALLQLAKYLEADSATADRAELEQFADVLVPGWRDRATLTRFLPHMIVSYAMATPEGRPEVDALAQQGVFLAGDWVGTENMLTDAAVASALRAAGMVQKKSARNAA
jgi:hypothetical protein